MTVIRSIGGDRIAWLDATTLEIAFAYPAMENSGINVSNVFPLVLLFLLT
jgi:hypothetical protein